MHGIIHAELKKYAMTVLGAPAWGRALHEAGIQDSAMMLATEIYPDEQTVALVVGLSKATNLPVDTILEGFGEFMAPDLMKMYKTLVKPSWTTREMLLNTEEIIHRVVRLRNPGAEPPRLQFVPVSDIEVKLYYHSRRNMAAVARGIIKGIAQYYGQKVDILETKKPDGSSEILVKIS